MSTNKISRSKQAANTKQILISKAFTLFKKHGYENVTVNQICQESGLTKGAFYHHFKSKADILVKRYKMAEGELLEYYNERMQLPPDRQLREIFDWYINFFQIDKLEETIVLHKIQMDSHFKNFALTSSLQRNILANIIRKGQASGCFKKHLDYQEVAGFILTYKWGLLTEWCAHNGETFSLEHRLNNFYEKYLKEFLFERNCISLF